MKMPLQRPLTSTAVHATAACALGLAAALALGPNTLAQTLSGTPIQSSHWVGEAVLIKLGPAAGRRLQAVIDEVNAALPAGSPEQVRRAPSPNEFVVGFSDLFFTTVGADAATGLGTNLGTDKILFIGAFVAPSSADADDTGAPTFLHLEAPWRANAAAVAKLGAFAQTATFSRTRALRPADDGDFPGAVDVEQVHWEASSADGASHVSLKATLGFGAPGNAQASDPSPVVIAAEATAGKPAMQRRFFFRYRGNPAAEHEQWEMRVREIVVPANFDAQLKAHHANPDIDAILKDPENQISAIGYLDRHTVEYDDAGN